MDLTLMKTKALKMSAPVPIVISLTESQRAFFAGFDREEEAAVAPIRARRNIAVTALVAGEVDPSTVATWEIRVMPDAIICTPPADPDVSG